MGMSEREHHIKVLEKMFYGMEKLENGVLLPTSEVKTALAYAISSLKTDEAYQLMYEGEEIFTKVDMVAMLEELQLEIRQYHEIGCDEDCNNCRMVGCVEPVNVIKDLDIIQQKIDKLKENKDGIN